MINGRARSRLAGTRRKIRKNLINIPQHGLQTSLAWRHGTSVLLWLYSRPVQYALDNRWFPNIFCHLRANCCLNCLILLVTIFGGNYIAFCNSLGFLLEVKFESPRLTNFSSLMSEAVLLTWYELSRIQQSGSRDSNLYHFWTVSVIDTVHMDPR